MKSKIINTLVIIVRLMLGALFVNAGYMKVAGVKEDLTEPDFIAAGEGIIKFFTFMESTGNYWVFIGACQITAGLLLITQRFATFGAIILMPISLNVLMVQMLFNKLLIFKLLDITIIVLNLLLLIYDYPKLKYIFYKRSAIN